MQLARVDPTRAAVAGLTLLALALRLPWLGESFWLDEALTGEIVRQMPGIMISHIANQAEAPLYFLAAGAWDSVFGFGDVATRLLSVFAGVATVPVAYSAARLLLNRRAALATAALVATSPPLIWYSMEARAYALWLFLCTLALFLWARARERDDWSFDAWAITSVLAFATHYFAIVMIVPQAVWLLARSRSRARAIRATLILAVGVSCLLPFAEYQRVHGGADWIAVQPLSDRLAGINRIFTSGVGWNGGFVEIAVPAILFLSVALVFFADDVRIRRGMLTLGALVGGAVVISFLGAVAGADYILYRNLLLVWVPLAAFLGAAAGVRGWAGTVGLVAVAAVAGLFVWQDLKHPSIFKREDWRAAARVLGTPRNDRLVVLDPGFGFAALARYSPGLVPTGTPRRVVEIDVVWEVSGNPWPDQVRAPRIPAGFRRARGTRYVYGILVVPYRARRPTLVKPQSLKTPGRAGSIALAWVPRRP